MSGRVVRACTICVLHSDGDSQRQVVAFVTQQQVRREGIFALWGLSRSFQFLPPSHSAIWRKLWCTKGEIGLVAHIQNANRNICFAHPHPRDGCTQDRAARVRLWDAEFVPVVKFLFRCAAAYACTSMTPPPSPLFCSSAAVHQVPQERLREMGGRGRHEGGGCVGRGDVDCARGWVVFVFCRM